MDRFAKVATIAWCLVSAACSGGGAGTVNDAGTFPDDPSPGIDSGAADTREQDDAGIQGDDGSGDPGLQDPGDAEEQDAQEIQVTDAPLDVGTQCQVLEPLELRFHVLGLEESETGVQSASGPAVVSYVGWQAGRDSKVESVATFAMEDTGTKVTAAYRLPFEYQVPVAVGQRVNLYVRREQALEHRDLVVVLWESGHDGQVGPPIFFLHDAGRSGEQAWYDCGKTSPCPGAKQVHTDCAPLDMDCGPVVFPPVELLMHGGASPGEAPEILEQGNTSIGYLEQRYAAARSERYIENGCADEPDAWLSAFVGRTKYVSQCRCMDDADCAGREFCDQLSARCLPDLCTKEALAAAGKTCKETWVCNAYTGDCVDPVKNPLQSCSTDDECQDGAICNNEMRFCVAEGECTQKMGACVQDPCEGLSCDSGCHSLLGSCFDCLADCECGMAGNGDFCGADGKCSPCDLQKIGFSRENPAGFELYVFCLSKEGDDPEAAVQAVDPTVNCKVPTGAGPFIDCDPDGELVCTGSLEFVPGTKWITRGKWGMVCDLGNMGEVVKFGGGYFL